MIHDVHGIRADVGSKSFGGIGSVRAQSDDGGARRHAIETAFHRPEEIGSGQFRVASGMTRHSERPSSRAQPLARMNVRPRRGPGAGVRLWWPS